MGKKGEEALDAVLFLYVALLVFRNTGRVVTTIVGGCRSLKSWTVVLFATMKQRIKKHQAGAK